ncbi:PREDICTED: uncharacterized protein LOC108363066 [Rhagoletis zephyria]|uniref:uncharacterized protein LOC108363066 n=1 Tax=Rhagoletis zephyria TaxID=28612 RepID=UPI0008116D5B|nr:PREDICTED: uncharacterized protein LOC108363066 [Rhagoletis zephyria]
MQQSPEIAQGFSKISKEEVMEFWENVAKELNSLGPPTKDVSSWKKVWLDWKAYIKRKLADNKREQLAAGGGRNRQHSFNEMEEEVIQLTALEASTHGIKTTVSVGLPEPVGGENAEAVADVSMASAPSPSLPRRAPAAQKRPDTSAADLLKEQLVLQKDFYEKSLQHFTQQDTKLDELCSGVRRLDCLISEAASLKVDDEGSLFSFS